LLALASQLFGKELFAKDEKKIGKAVNVLLDFSTAQAELIAFPHLTAKLVRDHSGKIAGMVAGQAISAIKQIIPGAEIADIIIDEAGGYAGGRTGGKVKQLFTTVQESYYALPSSLIGKVTAETITLSITYDDCRKWCLNAVPSPEIHMCLLEDLDKKAADRPVPITLNLPAMKDLVLVDASGIEAVVTDVAIPLNSEPGAGSQTQSQSQSSSTSVVIIDPRPSVQRGRLVPLANISRRGARFVTSKVLDQCIFAPST
jgi:hypothetical protein